LGEEKRKKEKRAGKSDDISRADKEVKKKSMKRGSSGYGKRYMERLRSLGKRGPKGGEGKKEKDLEDYLLYEASFLWGRRSRKNQTTSTRQDWSIDGRRISVEGNGGKSPSVEERGRWL